MIKTKRTWVHDIKTIIGQARTQAVRSVEFYRVQMYWKLGERIFNKEQRGKERADYGTYLILRWRLTGVAINPIDWRFVISFHLTTS